MIGLGPPADATGAGAAGCVVGVRLTAEVACDRLGHVRGRPELLNELPKLIGEVTEAHPVEPALEGHPRVHVNAEGANVFVDNSLAGTTPLAALAGTSASDCGRSSGFFAKAFNNTFSTPSGKSGTN